MSSPDPTHPLPPTGERRRSVRRPGNADLLSTAVLAGPDGPIGPTAVTCIVDYSDHGLGLIHPVEIAPGALFYLDTELDLGQPPARRLLRSTRCTAMGGGRFLIGAEFVNG